MAVVPTDAEITDDWYTKGTRKCVPTDQYWARVFKQKDVLGGEKYTNLKVFGKATLAISHGQINVERRFSVNKLLMTENRVSLKKKTIIALRIKDTIILITILIQFLYRKNYCKSFVLHMQLMKLTLLKKRKKNLNILYNVN